MIYEIAGRVIIPSSIIAAMFFGEIATILIAAAAIFWGVGMLLRMKYCYSLKPGRFVSAKEGLVRGFLWPICARS